MKRDFELLALELKECAALTENGVGAARQLVEITLSRGDFIKNQVYKDPLERVWRDGSLIGLPYSHELLWKEETVENFANLSFFADSKTLALSQGGRTEIATSLERMAANQVVFSLFFYQHLRPKYGWIDELGNNSPTDKAVKQCQLQQILWANFFGPAYVEKYGRDFLMNAPGWKKQELDDGGILHVVTESYCDWWTKPPKEVLEYFRAKLPGIKLYRAKQSPDF